MTPLSPNAQNQFIPKAHRDAHWKPAISKLRTRPLVLTHQSPSLKTLCYIRFAKLPTPSALRSRHASQLIPKRPFGPSPPMLLVRTKPKSQNRGRESFANSKFPSKVMSPVPKDSRPLPAPTSTRCNSRPLTKPQAQSRIASLSHPPYPPPTFRSFR